MNRKRYTPEQIIGMLREVEVALSLNLRHLFRLNELLFTNIHRMWDC
jgi:hypothetical protein